MYRIHINKQHKLSSPSSSGQSLSYHLFWKRTWPENIFQTKSVCSPCTHFIWIICIHGGSAMFLNENKVESFDWRKVWQFRNAVWKVRGLFLVFAAPREVNRMPMCTATALVNQLKIDLKYATNCTNVPTFELVLSHIRVILNHSETKEVFKIIKVNRMPMCTANALFWWLITSKQIEVRTKKMAPSLLCCCYDML